MGDLIGAQRAVFGSGLATTEKVVLLALLDHWSRRSQEPYPGIERLVSWTSLSRRAVISTIKRLEAVGALIVRHTPGKSSVYDLAPIFAGALPTADQCTTCTSAPRSLVHDVHQTSAPRAPLPVHDVHPKDPNEGSQEGTHVGRARKPKRAAPIPSSWEPTETHRAFAVEHGIDLALELIKFRGRWDGEAVKSPNGRFTTWLGNAVTFKRRDDARDAARGTTRARGPAPAKPAGEFDTSGDDFGGIV